MNRDSSPQTSQRGDSYLGSSSGSMEDEEDFMDDNSSTSTAGPPPDSPQSTGRFSRQWNLATAQPYGSEGSSPTSSLNTRNTNNRTGSFHRVGQYPSHSGNGSLANNRQFSHYHQPHSSSSQNTGTFPVRGTHSRTFSGTSASVSGMGSISPQEFSHSFRLFNPNGYLPGGGTPASRPRDGTGHNNPYRAAMRRNMDNNSSGRPSGVGETSRDTNGYKGRNSPQLSYVAGGFSYHQRQNSFMNTSYGGPNLNGSVCFHPQAQDLRNASMVFAGGTAAPLGFTNAPFLAGGATVSPLSVGVSVSPLRAQSFGTGALELAHYAMGSGQLISSNVTPAQRMLPTLLSTLRSYLCMNGQTIIVGDAGHPMEIKRGNLIGSGGFAKVYVGLNTCRGELVAVKEIQVVDVDDVVALREIEQEFALLRSLRHPNIVSYHLFEHSRSQKVCRIVMEFLAGDSTLHLLQKFGPLTEPVLRRITRHLLDAITYIHREGIFHRDIKPANILVSHKGEVKLCDFGCSKRISELNKASSCIIGTPVYMAPELIKGEATHKADVWSMGCTLFELATGLLPWYHSGVKDNLPLMFYITTTYDSPLVLPSTGDAASLEFSPEFMQFMESCFIRDPSRRPEAAELLKHPWITGIRTATPATSPHGNAIAAFAAALPVGTSSTGWSPRPTANGLPTRADSPESVGGPGTRPYATSPGRSSGLVSPHDSSATASHNEDSFMSELTAARLSTSTAVVANPPLGQDEAVAETELQCQQELEGVSALTTIDLCHSLMNFPEVPIKTYEQHLSSMDEGGTGPVTGTGTVTGTSESSPTITRTFSVPSQSLASHRGPVSISFGDFPSTGASPEHSMLNENFHYNQALLGASAGNFVLPTELPEPPAQQYLRINEDGNLDFATIHEYDSDTLRGKSTSADSSVMASFGSRMVSPGRNSSFSRASGSPGLPYPNSNDRRTSPQRSVTTSGFFPSPRGESPFKSPSLGGPGPAVVAPPTVPSAPGITGTGSPVPALHFSSTQHPPIPAPPLVAGARPSPLASFQSKSPRTQLGPAASNHGSDETQSPSSALTPPNASFRQLPEKAKVASDGRLHMSFSVSTSPGQEMSVPLNVDVSDVHCKMVDNQPNYFVALSNDIRGQITSRIKEAAAHSESVANSPVQSASSRTTSPRGGLPPPVSSASTLADGLGAGNMHQRVGSSSSGVHFYNTPSYRASRSPARPVSRLSSSGASQGHQQLSSSGQRPSTYGSQEALLPLPTDGAGGALAVPHVQGTPKSNGSSLGGAGYAVAVDDSSDVASSDGASVMHSPTPPSHAAAGHTSMAGFLHPNDGTKSPRPISSFLGPRTDPGNTTNVSKGAQK